MKRLRVEAPQAVQMETDPPQESEKTETPQDPKTKEVFVEEKDTIDDDLGFNLLDADQEPQAIILVTNDNVEYRFGELDCKGDLLIKKIPMVLSTLEMASDASAKEIKIPLGDVNAEQMIQIMQFLQLSEGKPPITIPTMPLKSLIMRDITDEWAADFIDSIFPPLTMKQKIYDLTSAANYLGMHDLVHLLCAKIASYIRGQPPDRIQGILLKTSTM